MSRAENVVAQARATYETGRTKDIQWRLEQLQQIYNFVSEKEAVIIEAERKDLRKPAFETVLSELAIVKSEAGHAINQLKNWVKPTYQSKKMLQLMDTVYTKPEPYGVVLIIGAWNFPINLVLCPLVGAIAAGNCAVLKTSEVAENTAELLERLLPKYLDSDCFHVYSGGISETTELLEQKFDYIFFTGNKRVGRIVMEAASKHLTPVTLELGGKSPVYVHNKSDVRMAASRIVWGKLLNLGQTCYAPDYIMCDAGIKDDFIYQLQKAITDQFGVNPQESSDLTRIINAKHFNRLKGLLDATEREKIVFGGNTDEGDKYIAPTIVDKCTLDDAVMSDELFGPIFPILTVSSKEQAVAIVNKLEKPLALYVFSKDAEVVEYVLANTSSGGVTVNDTVLHASNTNLPFGGVGASGFGSYHGKASFDTFSHHRSICYRKQTMEALLRTRYAPYTEGNMKINRRLIQETPGRCNLQ